MSNFHVVVIGSGPGGYVSAIRAAQLGYSVGIIEKENLGGICLNWGCIPTKALLKSAHLYREMQAADEYGIKTGALEADFPKIIQRSRGVAGDMSKGVDFLMKKNKIKVIKGTAKFLSPHKISVESSEGNSEIKSDYFIIAVGGRSAELPDIKIDGTHVIGYREAMTLGEKPESLCVIGAGAIGVEFADFYASLGVKVTILEYLPAILPIEDEEVSKALERSFKKRGIEMRTSVKVLSATPEGNNVKVVWEDGKGEKSEGIFSKALLAVGVRANTENLGLESIDVRLKRDRVNVDEFYNTSVKNIYAIGDCIPGPALAHVASMEGVRAAEAIKSKNGRNASPEYHPVNYEVIPGCTYCEPEVASVGLTEKAALAQGLSLKIGRFPFTASGRARAQGHSEGFVKIIADDKYHQILGAHIIGPGATELISEINLGMNMELTVEDLMNTMHAHPTLAEGVMEAAADVLGEALNI